MIEGREVDAATRRRRRRHRLLSNAAFLGIVTACGVGIAMTGPGTVTPSTTLSYETVDTVVLDGPRQVRLLVPDGEGGLRFASIHLATRDALRVVRDVPEGSPRHAEGVAFADGGWARLDGESVMVDGGDVAALTVHLRAVDPLQGGVVEPTGKGQPPTHPVTTLR